MHLDRKRDEMEDKIRYYIGTINELIAKVSDEYELELFADEQKKWLLCTLGAIRDNVKLHRLHGKDEFLDSINSLTTEIENYFSCNTAYRIDAIEDSKPLND